MKEPAGDARRTFRIQERHKRRKEPVERVFADDEEKPVMRCTQYRGLRRIFNRGRHTLSAMNRKKLAIWKWRDFHPSKSSPRFFFSERPLLCVSKTAASPTHTAPPSCCRAALCCPYRIFSGFGSSSSYSFSSWLRHLASSA